MLFDESNATLAITYTNLQSQNGQTLPDLDSDQEPPKKHNTLPVYILPSACDDL